MREMSLDEFRAEARAQGFDAMEFITFRCLMCGTLQCARDLMIVGAGATFTAVEKYLGFSCVGRWTNAGPPRKKPDGKPCNWTLGGFFQLHKVVVVTPDGERHPRFELASPEDARRHVAALAATETPR